MAGAALEPGQELILVSLRADMTPENPQQFDSLGALIEWRGRQHPDLDIFRIQYFAHTQSGRTFWLEASSAPVTLDAVRRDPAGYMDLADQGIDVLRGVGHILMEDDAAQLSITIIGNPDPVSTLVQLLEWYKPDEHGLQ